MGVVGLGKLSGRKSKLLFCVAILSLNSMAFGASKKKNKKAQQETTPVVTEETKVEQSEPETSVVSETAQIEEASVKLPSKKRTYFYKVDDSILDSIEDGSPDKIREAVAQIRQNASNLDESEKVLINVAAEIMRLVYPSEQIGWDTYAIENNNPYIGAISSVEQGIFDLSTGNNDFLTIILPALVITKNTVTAADYNLCENAVAEALKLKNNSTLANYLMAQVKNKKGQNVEAVAYYEKAYSNAPKNTDIALSYVNSLRMSGNLTEASRLLGLISGEASSLSILKQNAYIAFDAGDLANAELYVAKVLQQTPNDLEFVLFRARILIEKKDYIHAVSLLDMYARQNSTSIDYLVLRARVQLDWSKNTTAATETVEKALQLYPENTDALMFAARISSLTDSPVAGKYADELAGLVLAKNPENKEAMVYALDGLAQRENWTEAYQIGKKLISLENVSPEIVEKFVVICIKMNKTSEAYEIARKYYDLNPENETLQQAYIYSYCEVGNRDAVMKYIGTALNTSSAKMKSYLYYRRSFLQLTEENILADLRSSLISNPRNSDSLFRLYEMYFEKQDYRKAQYYLRQVVAINPNDNSVKKLNEALTKLIK